MYKGDKQIVGLRKGQTTITGLYKGRVRIGTLLNPTELPSGEYLVTEELEYITEEDNTNNFLIAEGIVPPIDDLPNGVYMVTEELEYLTEEDNTNNFIIGEA